MSGRINAQHEIKQTFSSNSGDWHPSDPLTNGNCDKPNEADAKYAS